MSRRARILAVQLSAVAAVAAAVVVPVVSGDQTALGSAQAAPPGPRRPVPPKVQELSLPAASKARPAQLAGRGTQRFALVGLTWPKQAGDVRTAAVRVRIDGTWTGWQQLAVDHEHTPDRAEGTNGRDGTEPLWVGQADGVQALVTAQDGTAVRGATVALIDPGTTADDAPAALDRRATYPAAAVSPASAAPPAIVSRRAWGADESLRNYNPDCSVPGYTPTIRAAFVHHTAGTNSYTSAQSAALLRGIYAFHVKSRGWCDVGYNFLVDKYGRVFEGRYGGVHVPVLGAHTGGYNSNSFGVSLMGEFTSTEPTATMMEATAKTIAWKLDGHYRNPNGTVTLADKTFNVIAGHRNATATECPGTRVYARLPWLRSRVLALMGNSYSTEIYRFAQQLGGEVKVGGAWWLEHPVAGGRGTWFTHRDIYWSQRTGTHSVRGGIRALHRQFGHAAGVLGFPLTEQGTSGPAAVQYFLRSEVLGAVYWTSATGSHEVLDKILAKYRAVGEGRSVIGAPVTGQVPAHAASGRVNAFQRGRIYTSATTGTFMIQGGINARYGSGTVFRTLGLPTTDQAAAKISGALVQRFQAGRIYWSAQTGAWETAGAIQTGYDRVGAESSRLGLPKGGMYDVAVGRAQDFTGGTITWNRSTGATTITYLPPVR